MDGQTDPNGPAIDDSEFADDGYGESQNSDTTSLTSSVLNYRMPNDETEKDRLDLILLLLWGELHLAPLEAPQAMLDLGTGTGIWAIDIAEGAWSGKFRFQSSVLKLGGRYWYYE
ncbi:hypothetical protein V8E54_004979 [Elaphomyces granulatus]